MARRPALPIADRKKLADALAQLERQEGGQVNAAMRLGVSPMYFWRLRHQRGGKGIGRELFNSILHCLPRDSWADLHLAVVSPPALSALKAYEAWIFDEIERSAHISIDDVIRRLERGGFGGWRAAFVKRATEAGHDERRIQLAVSRALAPLVAPQWTGLVEIGIWDLVKAKRLKAYLRHAFEREWLLLDRKPDMARAQEVASPTWPGKRARPPLQDVQGRDIHQMTEAVRRKALANR